MSCSPIPRRTSLLLAASTSALLAIGCGSSLTLVVEPREPTAPETVPSPQLSKYAYKRILLLPPEGAVKVQGVEVKAATEKDNRFYAAQLEKLLLAQGFDVISSEVVARAEGGKGKSAAEKAMILGLKSRADAVLMMQAIDLKGSARYFVVDEPSAEVDPDDVAHDDGEYYERATERCVHRIPYYEVGFEAKLIDSKSGAVLWVGNARQSSIDVIQDRWSASMDSDCEVLEENFDYAAYQADENTFVNTVNTLFTRLVKPLAKLALAGEPLDKPAVVVEEPPPPPPQPEPPPPPEPKAKMATVSAPRAALRDSPSKRGPRKMVVPRKARVEVLEVMGEWFKVKVQDGSVGWMHESTVIQDAEEPAK